jgi:hypothetical protein
MQVSILGSERFRWLVDGTFEWDESEAEWRRVIASNNIVVNDDGSIDITTDVDITGSLTVNGVDINGNVAGLTGGTPGQVLTKASDTNFDYTWEDATGGGGGGGVWGTITGTLSDQTDLQDALDALGSVAGVTTGHRYWKFVMKPDDPFDIGITSMTFTKNAGGFKNGLRWYPGEDLGIAIPEISGAISSGPENTLTFASVYAMFDGNPVTQTSFVRPGSTLPSDVASFIIDFDLLGNQAPLITSVDLTVGDGPTIKAPLNLDIYYSDDNVTYTPVSVFDFVPLELANTDSTPTLANIYDPGPGSADDVIFDPTVRTIPPKSSTGGGVFVSYQRILDSDITCEANNYYILDGVDTESQFTFTLPSAPSPGDRIGIQKANPFMVLPLVDLSLKPYRGVVGTFEMWDTLFFDWEPSACELVYIDDTYGWAPTFGQLVEQPG